MIKFSLCRLVVLDNGTPFKGVFITMCKALNFNYDALDRLKQKNVTLENFHNFLNKSVTIATEDRTTNDILFPIGVIVC